MKACHHLRGSLVAVLLLVPGSASAQAQPVSDPCTAFPWDVRAVVTAFGGSVPDVLTAGGPDDVPQIPLGAAHNLMLSPQESVVFAAGPERPTLDDGSRAGLVRFVPNVSGRYLIALTTGHWIDLVDGSELVPSVAFQGSPGCARPRKIVEFELQGGRTYVLQFSGGTEPVVGVVVAPAVPLPSIFEGSAS